MEKEILEGIRGEIAALRKRLDELELRLAETDRIATEGVPFDEPVSIDIDLPDATAAAVVTAAAPAEEPAPESAPEPVAAPAEEAAPAVEPVLAPEPASAPAEEAAPAVESVPEPAPIEAPVPEPVPLERKLGYSWCIAECGTKISNVISGISLSDRLLVINCLFGEDPVRFQQAVSDINALGSFDEAVAYVMGKYPSWPFDSAPVHTFMMAVRRRFK